VPLTVADIKRWKADAGREVFHASRAGAEISITVSDELGSLPVFQTWGGDAAQAAETAIGRTQLDLISHGDSALAVAKAANEAADGIKHIQDELKRLEDDAGQLGFYIAPITNRVLPGPNIKGVLVDAMTFQQRLDAILAEADAVDQDLADAINLAEEGAPVLPDGSEAPIPPSGPTVLGDINRTNDSAMLAAIERVKKAQAEVNALAGKGYMSGPGNPDPAAAAAMAKARAELADALNDLGQVPDYSGIDPTSVRLTTDGHVSFTYLLNGQLVDVSGLLRNGTGQLYDPGKMAYFNYQNGNFIGADFLDDGRAIAISEPMFSVIATAVGAGPMVKGAQADGSACARCSAPKPSTPQPISRRATY
jgi:hypothetical protein